MRRNGIDKMGLKEKSKVNARLAHALRDDGEYNAAVNRFYYSVFQKLHNAASEKWKYAYDSTEGSSHQALIGFVSNKISECAKDEDLRMDAMKAKQVTGSFRALKKLRVQADYLEKCIDEKEMKTFSDNYEKFNAGYSSFRKLEE
ncbi:hypothetical protein CSV77_13760 [Sporosarcina sp. P16b]|uniref:hypothetical protein n=1 Tax=Sporosarcina sp. P16b TaxID=2048261 RepID=UPI000C166F49|nr:hypothetical protein [Sporosarcina sp. P16b]PIC69468.1 hypothetical protein CSV77_13760 [Sporosarcina sp. P16b]